MRRSLGTIQKWMQELVIGGGMDPELANLIESPNIGAESGMAIYVRAYRSRLIECMEKEYPILMHALGKRTFGVFAEGYLRSCPPRTYTLSMLGDRFPQYLRESRPEGQSDSWGDFVIELARLERNFFEVFDAPGSEERKLPDAGDVDGVGPGARGAFLRMHVVPVPCLRLLEFDYPVDAYFIGVKKGRNPPLPHARKTFMAMSRRDYVVRFYSLSGEEFGVLKGLMDGLVLKEAGGKISGKKLRKMLAKWLDKGFFLEIK